MKFRAAWHLPHARALPVRYSGEGPLEAAGATGLEEVIAAHGSSALHHSYSHLSLQDFRSLKSVRALPDATPGNVQV